MNSNEAIDAIVIDAVDNVATALRKLEPGEKIRVGTPSGRLSCEVVEAIPLCHKLAMADLAAGEQILKYGTVIGSLKARARAGSLIHVHNIESRRARR